MDLDGLLDKLLGLSSSNRKKKFLFKLNSKEVAEWETNVSQSKACLQEIDSLKSRARDLASKNWINLHDRHSDTYGKDLNYDKGSIYEWLDEHEEETD